MKHYGDHPHPLSPKMWNHAFRLIQFCLYIDDFGVKFTTKYETTISLTLWSMKFLVNCPEKDIVAISSTRIIVRVLWTFPSPNVFLRHKANSVNLHQRNHNSLHTDGMCRTMVEIFNSLHPPKQLHAGQADAISLSLHPLLKFSRTKSVHDLKISPY